MNCYFCHAPVGETEVEIVVREHGDHHYWDRTPAHPDCLEAARRCYIDPNELRALVEGRDVRTERPSVRPEA